MPKNPNYPETKNWTFYFAKYFLLATLSSSAIVTSIILYYHWETARIFRASKYPSILDHIVPAEFLTAMSTFLFGVIISIYFVLTDRQSGITASSHSMGYYDDFEVVNVLISTLSGCKWTLLRFMMERVASVMDSRGY